MSLITETLELSLPVARNRLGQMVLTRKDVISAFARENGLDPMTFLSSLIISANEIGVAIGDAATKHSQTQVSFVRAALNCAVIGLMPGIGMGHCYLIPFNRRPKGASSGHKEIQWIAGYRGLMELAFRNNFLSYCSTEVVLQSEQIQRGFTEHGPWLKHDIPIPRQQPQRAAIIGAYCTYGTRHGKDSMVYVESYELDAVDTKRDVWRANPVAMCKKTAIRRAAKEWQMSRSLSLAVTLDEAADRGEVQPELVPDAGSPSSREIDLDDITERGDGENTGE